jgi:hypothetical protein
MMLEYYSLICIHCMCKMSFLEKIFTTTEVPVTTTQVFTTATTELVTCGNDFLQNFTQILNVNF